MMMQNSRLVRLPSFGGLFILGASLFLAKTVQAHGYASDPPSRGAVCALGCVSNCGDIQYEPQSVEGPKGFPAAGPPDGAICSAGNLRFAQLDDPRRIWPASPVNAGPRNVTWTFTAPHATAKYHYYITNNGPSVNRANLTEIGTFQANGVKPGQSISHTVQLPPRSGRQVLLAVWDVADTTNAFYSCIDVKYR